MEPQPSPRKAGYCAPAFVLHLFVLLAWVALPSLAAAARFTHPTDGYSFTYPTIWNVRMHGNGRGVVLRNFPAEKTPRGGFVPPGGATIIMHMFPPYFIPNFPQGVDDDTALANIVRGDTIVSQTKASKGQRASVTAIYTPHNLRMVWTVLHLGERVFLLSLDCNADDRHASAYDHVLDAVATSIFVSTPSPSSTNQIAPDF